MGPRERFLRWLAWLGVSEAEVSRRLGCDASYPRRIRLGERRPGIDVAVAIETETSQPREDGEVWPEGPIRATEWAAHPASVESAAPAVESAS
jgi:hypothetical protein